MSKENHHVISYGMLTLIWVSLLILTGVTVYASTIDFGFLNVTIALSIATFKALLVIIIFMHIKYENSLLKLMVFICFLILAIFIGFTFFDVAYR